MNCTKKDFFKDLQITFFYLLFNLFSLTLAGKSGDYIHPPPVLTFNILRNIYFITTIIGYKFSILILLLKNFHYSS